MNTSSPPPPSPPLGLDPLKLAAAVGSLHTLGVLFFILGFMAMVFPQIAGLAIDILLGWLFIFTGVASVASVFGGHGKHHPHATLTVLIGIVGLIAGLCLIIHPMRGILTLTLLVAAGVAAQGVVELAWAMRPELLGKRTWLVISGVCGLLLGGLIIAKWPNDSAWVLGFLFGIKLLFTGSAFMSLPSTAPAATK